MDRQPVLAQDLINAARIYLSIAYAGQTPPIAVQERLAAITSLGASDPVPEALLEPSTCNQQKSFALRLGQPTYPHMKLMMEPGPEGGWLYRADAHDAHLHAPPGSPDAAPLAALRAHNKVLTEAIEAAWAAAGIQTFRDYLKKDLARRLERKKLEARSGTR